MEFAIVAPLFFLLLFGMIEFGRGVLVQQMITNASREGARRAVLEGATIQEVDNVVNNYLASAAILGATINVDPSPPSGAAAGDPVTVTVQIPFSQVSWLPAPLFLENATMSATSVMRRESVQ
ncbi:MAG: TadE/TadG family type IV pilus assembly protein [Pirellulaceae bacterium]